MAYYIASDRFGNYDLVHHGIKGQRWGVRRFQNTDGSLTAAGKTRYGSSEPGLHDVNRKGNRGELYARLTNIGLNIVTLNPMILYNVPALAVRAVQAGQAKVKTKLSDERLNSAPIDKKTGLHKKTREWSMDEDCEAVNPGYKNFNTDTKNNCVLCTMTYDLRRRGFDVVAGKAGQGFTTEEYSRWYKGAKSKSIQELKAPDAMTDMMIRNRSQYLPGKKRQEFREALANDAESTLKKQGVGARGLLHLSITGRGFSGHAVAYEVTSSGVVVYDAQSGKKHTLTDLSKICTDIHYMRLDNLTPNYELMKKEGVIR